MAVTSTPLHFLRCKPPQQLTEMALPLASAPLHARSGSPCVAGSAPWNRSPSFLGPPLLPVGGGAGRYSTRLAAARSSWSQGRPSVAPIHRAEA